MKSYSKVRMIMISMLVLISGLIIPAYTEDEPGLKPGDDVPEFVFFDSAGSKIKIDQYVNDKPVVITFFGTYCQPCKKEIPFLVSQSNKGKNFKLVLVVTDTGDDAAIVKYLKQAGVKEPYVYDYTGGVLKDFFVKDLPHSVFIGKSGKIASVEKGYTPRKNKDLIKLIKSLGDM